MNRVLDGRWALADEPERRRAALPRPPGLMRTTQPLTVVNARSGTLALDPTARTDPRGHG